MKSGEDERRNFVMKNVDGRNGTMTILVLDWIGDQNSMRLNDWLRTIRRGVSNWFKRFFDIHEHNYEFHMNLYGDQINRFNGRSVWICSICKHWKVSRLMGP